MEKAGVSVPDKLGRTRLRSADEEEEAQGGRKQRLKV